LTHLTPEQQQIISLKFLEGLSNAEVAAVVEKPLGAVKSLQHRGLAALQRLLTPPEREDEPARLEFPA
jgi:RNA polymerase sigma-70 factor (ECF subfamily)